MSDYEKYLKYKIKYFNLIKYGGAQAEYPRIQNITQSKLKIMLSKIEKITKDYFNQTQLEMLYEFEKRINGREDIPQEELNRIYLSFHAFYKLDKPKILYNTEGTYRIQETLIQFNIFDPDNDATNFANRGFYKKYRNRKEDTVALTNGMNKAYESGQSGTNSAVTKLGIDLHCPDERCESGPEDKMKLFKEIYGKYYFENPRVLFNSMELLNKLVDEKKISIDEREEQKMKESKKSVKKGLKYDVGTVLIKEDTDKNMYGIRRVYHINGFDLNKSRTPEQTEGNIFSLEYEYYKAILINFMGSDINILVLNPIPGRLFGGGEITEFALLLAVYDCFKIKDFKQIKKKLILGIDPKNTIFSKKNPNIRYIPHEYWDNIYECISIFLTAFEEAAPAAAPAPAAPASKLSHTAQEFTPKNLLQNNYIINNHVKIIFNKYEKEVDKTNIQDLSFYHEYSSYEKHSIGEKISFALVTQIDEKFKEIGIRYISNIHHKLFPTGENLFDRNKMIRSLGNKDVFHRLVNIDIRSDINIKKIYYVNGYNNPLKQDEIELIKKKEDLKRSKNIKELKRIEEIERCYIDEEILAYNKIYYYYYNIIQDFLLSDIDILVIIQIPYFKLGGLYVTKFALLLAIYNLNLKGLLNSYKTIIINFNFDKKPPLYKKYLQYDDVICFFESMYNKSSDEYKTGYKQFKLAKACELSAVETNIYSIDIKFFELNINNIETFFKTFGSDKKFILVNETGPILEYKTDGVMKISQVISDINKKQKDDFFNNNNAVKINEIKNNSNNGFFFEKYQHITINKRSYPAGTIFYIPSIKKEKVIGIYHIKGPDLRNNEKKIFNENKIFNEIIKYYEDILDNFIRYRIGDYIYLPPVPSGIYKGTYITKYALFYSVCNIIKRVKEHNINMNRNITIIIGFNIKILRNIKDIQDLEDINGNNIKKVLLKYIEDFLPCDLLEKIEGKNVQWSESPPDIKEIEERPQKKIDEKLRKEAEERQQREIEKRRQMKLEERQQAEVMEKMRIATEKEKRIEEARLRDKEVKERLIKQESIGILKKAYEYIKKESLTEPVGKEISYDDESSDIEDSLDSIKSDSSDSIKSETILEILPHFESLVKLLKNIFPIIPSLNFSEFVRYDILMSSEEKKEFKTIYYNIFKLLEKIGTVHEGGGTIKSLKNLSLDEFTDKIKKILYDGLECIESIKYNNISRFTLNVLKKFETVLKYINKYPEIIYDRTFKIEDDEDLLNLINYDIIKNTPGEISESYKTFKSYQKQQKHLITLIKLHDYLL